MEEVPLQIREFFDARGHLSISNGLLTYDDRIVIASDTGSNEKENTGKHSHRPPGRNKVQRPTCPYGGRLFPKRLRQRWSHASSVSNTNRGGGENL